MQNASHMPFALTGLKFFASLTSTCNEPFDDELRELVDDFMLPNLRKPLLMDDLEKCDVFESGGTNFKPTIMSPRYVERSSNGSLYKHYETSGITEKKQEKEKNKNIERKNKNQDNVTNKGITFFDICHKNGTTKFTHKIRIFGCVFR